MRRPLVIAFYRLSKLLGLFHVSRVLTRHGLRILCYHGFSTDDEDRFRPGLFIRRDDFERRLAFLARHRFPVLSLEKAVELLDEGRLPPCATVITIDDGFHSVFRLALPALETYGFPATLYLTSYYFAKETPIFRLCVSYMLWKTAKTAADLSGIGVPALGSARWVSLGTSEDRERVSSLIVEFGETHCDEPTRCAIARGLGTALDVDYDHITGSRMLSLVNADEVRSMTASLIDVQLHSHRHRLPVDAARASLELAQNKAELEPIVGRPRRHFCYPSGDWSPAHWPALEAAGITTATTCDSGLVYDDTPRLALGRMLDSARVSQIEFEAEMFGYSELLRKIRRRLRPRERANR